MRKLWIVLFVAAFSLLAAVGAMLWGWVPEESDASEQVQFLKPWAVEVWRQGPDAILGSGLMGAGPETAFLYSPGRPLRNYSFTTEKFQIGGRLVKVFSSDDVLLGIKHTPSAFVQSAVAPGGSFALVTTGAEVALVRGQDVQVISPRPYQGTDLATWGKSLSQVSLFSSPMVSDSGTFALRVMVPGRDGAPVVSVWRGDTGSESLHVVLIGKPGEANNIAGFRPDGRLVVWDLATGVFAVDAGGDIARIGRAGLTAESVSRTGLVFSVDTANLKPFVITAAALELPLQGLPEKSVFSYWAAWASDGSRVAFLAGEPSADPYLVVAEVEGDSFRVANVYSSPDSDARFVADGPLGWANDFDVIAFTQAKDSGKAVKTWVFNTRAESGN